MDHLSCNHLKVVAAGVPGFVNGPAIDTWYMVVVGVTLGVYHNWLVHHFLPRFYLNITYRVEVGLSMVSLALSTVSALARRRP